MSYDTYDSCARTMLAAMTNLKGILDKAKASGVAEAELMETRLAPDMLAFPKQVQRASDTAKSSVERLTGVAAPSMEDTETTFDELKARLEKTIAFVQSVGREAYVGAEDREVVIKLPSRELRMSGRDYVTAFGLPNFFFHQAMAYAILRQKGVEIGKLDWLGGAPQ